VTPDEVPEEILEAAVRAAWENETGCMWNSRSRVHEKGRNDLRVALAAALPLWTDLVDETRRSNDPLDSDRTWPAGDRYAAPPGEGF
jgi:hypothetical protein